MKAILIALALVILVLLIRLLSSDGGIGEYLSLQTRLETLQEEVDQQIAVNQLLRNEVEDLQSGTEAIETIARQKLGMIAQDEVFIQVIEVPVIPNSTSQPRIFPTESVD